MTRAAAIAVLAGLVGFLLGGWARPDADPVGPVSPLVGPDRAADRAADRADVRAIVREEIAPLLAEIRALERPPAEPDRAPGAEASPSTGPASAPRPSPAPIADRRPPVEDFRALAPKPGAGYRLPDSHFLLRDEDVLARYGRPDRVVSVGSSAIQWQYDFPTGEIEGDQEFVEVYRFTLYDGRLYRVETPIRSRRKPAR